jgi:hypothetical protein
VCADQMHDFTEVMFNLITGGSGDEDEDRRSLRSNRSNANRIFSNNDGDSILSGRIGQYIDRDVESACSPQLDRNCPSQRWSKTNNDNNHPSVGVEDAAQQKYAPTTSPEDVTHDSSSSSIIINHNRTSDSHSNKKEVVTLDKSSSSRSNADYSSRESCIDGLIV